MTPPEFAGQNICGGCEGEGHDLDLSRPVPFGPLRSCRFCGGTGEKAPGAPLCFCEGGHDRGCPWDDHTPALEGDHS